MTYSFPKKSLLVQVLKHCCSSWSLGDVTSAAYEQVVISNLLISAVVSQRTPGDSWSWTLRYSYTLAVKARS